MLTDSDEISLGLSKKFNIEDAPDSISRADEASDNDSVFNFSECSSHSIASTSSKTNDRLIESNNVNFPGKLFFQVCKCFQHNCLKSLL